MDEDAVSPVIGVVLMLGVLAVLATAAAVMLQPPDDGIDPIQTSSQATVQGDNHIFRITGPEAIPLDGTWMVVYTPAGEARIPMTEFADQTADGENWDVGDSLCVTGSRPACRLPAQSETRVEVYTAQHWVFSLAIGDASGPAPAAPKAKDCFAINVAGAIKNGCDLAWDAYVVGSEITNGPGGAAIPTYLYVRLEDGSWEPLFGGGHVTGGELASLGVYAGGTEVGFLGEAKLGSFNPSYASDSGDPHVAVLRDGDPIPAAGGFDGQEDVGTMLGPYTDGKGNIDIQPNEIIILWEFNSDLGSPAADYQDMVVLLQASLP